MEFPDEAFDFESMLRGEVADDFDVEAMTSIALDVVAETKAEVHQRMSVTVESTGAELDLRTIWYEGAPDLGKHLVIGIGRMESPSLCLEVGFDFNNTPAEAFWDGAEDLIETRKILDEVLTSDRTEMHPMATYLLALTEHLQAGQIGAPAPDPSLLEHPADTVKRLVSESEGKRGVAYRTYETALSNNRSLTVNRTQMLGFPADFFEGAEVVPTEEQLRLLNIAGLRVRLTEEDGLVEREFLSLMSGDYGMAVGFSVIEDETNDGVTTEDSELGEQTKRYNVVRTDDLGALTEALLEARMREKAIEEAHAYWTYPELPFGFNVLPGDSVDEIVQAAMKALDTTAKYFLPEAFPEGFPLQPNYEYNSRKLNRIDSYLSQKIYSPLTETTERRYKVIDITKAAEATLDRLAIENHPVAQMIATLHYDFGSEFDTETMQAVAVEVVKLTHWKELRAILADQSNRWRKFGAILQVESVDV